MTRKNYLFIPALLVSFLFILSAFRCSGDKGANFKKSEVDIAIPTTGNSWVVSDVQQSHEIVTKAGVKNWTDKKSIIRTFFHTKQIGKVHIALRAKVNSGESKVIIRYGEVAKEIKLNNLEFDTIPVGTFYVDKPGYHWLDMQGVEKSSVTFAEVSDILIGGDATLGELNYVKDDYYWGRRGPSVHLSYQIPEETKDVVWFYNEITVPEGNDVIGSYYMANGFGEGYFGMQANSPTERRILFSVWSPYKTDNPNEIPEDQRIKLLKKGDDVNTGEFGNEGSGGQSFRRYNWKAGTTYRFLLKGNPSKKNCTDYTAYFFAPEIGKWELIASFRRPKTNTYLKRPHSFLENFRTEMGSTTRRAIYSNQWVYDTAGKWHELTIAKFTADATARKGARVDYSGGLDQGGFYMKNCGFFSEKTEIGSMFTREKTGNIPDIDFSALP